MSFTEWMSAVRVAPATRHEKTLFKRTCRITSCRFACFVFPALCTNHRIVVHREVVMRNLLLGTVAILALVAANAAQAADLGVPAKGPMAAPLPAWNWSGFYAGLNAGYARGTTV